MNQEESEHEIGDLELVSRHRRRIAKQLFGEEKPKPQPKRRKSPKRGRRLVFLLFMQIILLAVWAALFFSLGMLTQYEMIPFLPKLVEAVRVILSP